MRSTLRKQVADAIVAKLRTIKVAAGFNTDVGNNAEHRNTSIDHFAHASGSGLVLALIVDDRNAVTGSDAQETAVSEISFALFCWRARHLVGASASDLEVIDPVAADVERALLDDERFGFGDHVIRLSRVEEFRLDGTLVEDAGRVVGVFDFVVQLEHDYDDPTRRVGEN